MGKAYTHAAILTVIFGLLMLLSCEEDNTVDSEASGSGGVSEVVGEERYAYIIGIGQNSVILHAKISEIL